MRIKWKPNAQHVVKAFCLLGFTTLSRSLFFQIFICSTIVNLLNCKHRIGFSNMLADGIIISLITSNQFRFKLCELQMIFGYDIIFCNFNLLQFGLTNLDVQHIRKPWRCTQLCKMTSPKIGWPLNNQNLFHEKIFLLLLYGLFYIRSFT